MLKIKDNVDLKELENYGFKFEKENNLFSNRYTYDDKEQIIAVRCEDRLIYTEDISGNYLFGAIVESVLTKLYDLIKADLVEKVDE